MYNVFPPIVSHYQRHLPEVRREKKCLLPYFQLSVASQCLHQAQGRHHSLCPVHLQCQDLTRAHARFDALLLLSWNSWFFKKEPRNCVASLAVAAFLPLPPFSFLRKECLLLTYFSLPTCSADPWLSWVGPSHPGRDPQPTFGSSCLSKPLSTLPSGRLFRHPKPRPLRTCCSYQALCVPAFSRDWYLLIMQVSSPTPGVLPSWHPWPVSLLSLRTFSMPWGILYYAALSSSWYIALLFIICFLPLDYTPTLFTLCTDVSSVLFNGVWHIVGTQ